MFRQLATWMGLSERERRLALRVILVFFTVLIALAIAGSFISYERVVSQGHPWLPHYQCPGCIFCGMTRSFCALSSGHWHEAWAWNRGGPFLYAGGWLWLIGAALIFLRRGARKKGRAFKLALRGGGEVANQV